MRSFFSTQNPLSVFRSAKRKNKKTNRIVQRNPLLKVPKVDSRGLESKAEDFWRALVTDSFEGF